jgi:hypothetical protein
MKKVYVNVDEESLRARRGLVRQGSNFDQVEIMTILTKEDFSLRLPMTKRTHYPGTSMGNKIGDVVLDATDTMWSLTCAEKIVVHGKFRQQVGGLTKGEERTVLFMPFNFHYSRVLTLSFSVSFIVRVSCVLSIFFSFNFLLPFQVHKSRPNAACMAMASW